MSSITQKDLVLSTIPIKTELISLEQSNNQHIDGIMLEFFKKKKEKHSSREIRIKDTYIVILHSLVPTFSSNL